MLEISLDSSNSHYIIRSYEPGKIVINQQEIHQSLILTSQQLITPWHPDDLNALINLSPEIVLLGTGEKWKMLESNKLILFYQQHIGIEMMDSLSACKTFNVLAAEGRNVAAGIVV